MGEKQKFEALELWRGTETRGVRGFVECNFELQ
jgi:hypothetical protein